MTHRNDSNVWHVSVICHHSLSCSARWCESEIFIQIWICTSRPMRCSYICVSCICDMTQSYVCRDSFQICAMTYSHVCHDSHILDTWHDFVYPHSNVCHDVFICAPQLTHQYAVTHSYVCRDSFQQRTYEDSDKVQVVDESKGSKEDEAAQLLNAEATWVEVDMVWKKQDFSKSSSTHAISTKSI